MNRLIRSSFQDPFENLALEELYFRSDELKFPSLMIYTHKPCVVLGNFQNPWAEIDSLFLDKYRHKVVRRVSGGGCVYHDQGNVNWSFMEKEENYSKEKHFRVVQLALEKLNLNSQLTCRNDLLIEGKKISGSAFKQIRGKKMHHGTMLISTNLNDLRGILKNKDSRIVSKATESNRSSVLNLNTLNPKIDTELFIEKLTEAFSDVYGEVSIKDEFQDISNRAKELRDFNWVFGKTPKFTRAFQLDGTEGEVFIEKGRVEKIELESDLFHPDFFIMINKKLKGTLYLHSELSLVRENLLGIYDEELDKLFSAIV